MAGRQQDSQQPVAEEEQRDQQFTMTSSHAGGACRREGCSPPGLHTKQDLPVLQSSVVVGVPKHLCENRQFTALSNLWPRRCPVGRPLHYLALLPQPLGLLAVDVALHAGLSSADEHSVPQGESSQSHRHRAAREEEGHHPTWPGQDGGGGQGAALTWSAPRGR